MQAFKGVLDLGLVSRVLFYTVQDATLSHTDYAENARFFTVLLFYKINK